MAVLADAANVREGLLSVLSAGVSTIYRDLYPAPIGATLCIMIELSGAESERANPVHVLVNVAGDDGTVIATLDGDLQFTPGPLHNHDRPSYLPFVLDLSQLSVPTPGTYAVEIHISDLAPISLPIFAEPSPAMPNPV